MTDTLPRLKAALGERYAIEREIGVGGMATVYLAKDLRHGRPVALKVVRPELSGAGGTARFLREIELAARLQHPHILPVFDSGTVDDGAGGQTPWFVMPFVEGETLRARLARDKQLPVEDAISLAAEVGDALAYAHAHGVDPPRHQAREHPDERRPRRRGRLRRRQGDRERRRAVGRRAGGADPVRLRGRHAQLHGTGAGDRPGSGGREGRPVQPRLRAVRDAGWRRALLGRYRAVRGRAEHDGAAAPRREGAPGRVERAGGRRHPRDGDRSRRPLPRYERHDGGAAPGPRQRAPAEEDHGRDRGGRHRRGRRGRRRVARHSAEPDRGHRGSRDDRRPSVQCFGSGRRGAGRGDGGSARHQPAGRRRHHRGRAAPGTQALGQARRG